MVRQDLRLDSIVPQPQPREDERASHHNDQPEAGVVLDGISECLLRSAVIIRQQNNLEACQPWSQAWNDQSQDLLEPRQEQPQSSRRIGGSSQTNRGKEDAIWGMPTQESQEEAQEWSK